VEFNVWEYCSSDELFWTEMIRNLYEKVELRMSKKIDKSSGISFKEIWRIKKAIGLLRDTYGGKEGLRNSCIVFVAVTAIAVVIFVNRLLFMPAISSMLTLNLDTLALLLPGFRRTRALVIVEAKPFLKKATQSESKMDS